MTTQDDIFSASEGDQWFERNKAVIGVGERLDSDVPLLLLSRHPEVQPNDVLEIGCSNGWRLAELRKRYETRCVGIDPSEEAIKQGQSAFSDLSLDCGLASNLPFEDASFDLVIFSFVLHWIDRSSLIRSLTEADRVLRDDGYLLISDFYPDSPVRRSYHHLPKEDVFTYKQDYAEVFLSSMLYTRTDRIVFHHDSMQPGTDIPPNDRAACTLLQKKLTELYATS